MTQSATETATSPPNPSTGLLRGARVYLSGPMDFVASREVEKEAGWRNRIGTFLRSYGITVFDPWNKPDVRGLYEFGKEGEGTTDARRSWTFEQGPKGAAKRAEIAEQFWPALHIDLRMVDTSDFIICYCPTNIYSVGTPHEIIIARQQRKPVLFVSPYVVHEKLHELTNHLKGDEKGLKLLDELVAEVPIKENLNGSPSLWYMPLIGGEHFFDGFGFNLYRDKYAWKERTDLDEHEQRYPLTKPLLPFLEAADRRLPEKWNRNLDKFGPNDDWLIWDLKTNGACVEGPRDGKYGKETT